MPGVYISEEDVLAETWYAVYTDPSTGNRATDPSIAYTGDIIFFAIEIGWGND